MIRTILISLMVSALALPCFAEESTGTATSSEANPAGKTKKKGEAKEKAPKAPKFTKKDIKKGTGAKAESGKTITVHYSGYLYDPSKKDKKGKKFDSSVDRGEPFKFQLGAGMVIRGWDEGFDGMKVGGKRQLIIPAEMGYGERGTPDGAIPPNSTLLFDVELLGVE